MNYSELTDFEINKLVAERAEIAGLFSYIIEVNEEKQVVYLCEKDGVFSIIPISHYDPCNNPSDAWPIILSSGISLINIKGTTAWFAGNDFESYTMCMSPDGSDNGVSCYDIQNCEHNTNPLRAAMICFLMMGDK